MAIYKVQGPDGRILTVEGPANAPEDEVIQQAHLLYTQQQAHEAKTGIGAAFKHGLTEGKASAEQGIATLLGAAGMKNYSQDWLNASEAARKEAAGMYEGTTEEDIARARAENGPIAELLAKGKKHIAEPLGEMGGRFGPTMVMSAPMFGPLGLGAAGLNEYLASVGEVKHRGGDDTESMLYGGPLAALNVAKIPTGRLGTYASEAVAKGLGRVTPEAAEAGVREAALAAREAKAAEVAGVANKGDLGPLSTVENLAVQEAKAAPFQAAQEAATRAAAEVPGQRTWGGFAGDVAAGAAGNAAVNIPLSLASEALTRHATGEKPMTAEEAGELSQQLALLSPIFGAGHAVIHNPVREAKLRAEGAATAEGVSPEAIDARKDVAAAQELKDQYDIDNTPFHPEQSTDQLWETLRTQSGRDDVPAYSDLSDKQRKGFNDAVKAKGAATRESKDQPGVYEPKKNTVTAFERIAGKPEKVPVPEAGAELATPAPAPETELTTPEAGAELATPTPTPDFVVEPTTRSIKPADTRKQIADISAQLFEQHYPGEDFTALPDHVKKSWNGTVNSKWKNPESFTVPTSVRKYLETNTPEKAYQEAIGKLKVEPVSIEELKNTPPDIDGNTIWDSISKLHTPGKSLNIDRVTQNVKAYHELKANAERDAERQRIADEEEAARQSAEQAELERQKQVYDKVVAASKEDTDLIKKTFDEGLTPVPPTRKPAAPIIEERPVPVKSEAVAPITEEKPAAPVVEEKPTEPKSKLADLTEDELYVRVAEGTLPEAALDRELKRRNHEVTKPNLAEEREVVKAAIGEGYSLDELEDVDPIVTAAHERAKKAIADNSENPTEENTGNAVDAAINLDNAQAKIEEEKRKAAEAAKEKRKADREAKKAAKLKAEQDEREKVAKQAEKDRIAAQVEKDRIKEEAEAAEALKVAEENAKRAEYDAAVSHVAKIIDMPKDRVVYYDPETKHGLYTNKAHKYGITMYMPFIYKGKDGITRRSSDVSDATWLDPKIKQTLVAKADQLKKESFAAGDKQMKAMFGEGQIAVKLSDPGMSKIASAWATQLGLDRLPNGKRVFITDKEWAQNAKLKGSLECVAMVNFVPGLNGLHIPLADINNKPAGVYAITIDNALSPHEQLEVLAHEMGHTVETMYLNNAPKEVQAAIKADFKEYLKAQRKAATSHDIDKLFHSPAIAEKAKEAYPARQRERIGSEALNYYSDFSEWFANQTARWATSAEQPRSVVDKFFAGLGKILREFFTKNKEYLPEKSVAEFLNSIKDRASEYATNQEEGGTVGEVQYSRSLQTNDPLIKRAVDSGYTTMKDIEAPKTIPERVKGMNSWMDSFFQKFVNEWHGVETTLAPHLGKMVGEKQRADLVGRFMSTAPNFITNALQMGGIELLKDGTMDITKIPVRLSSGKVVNASIYEMQRQVDKIGKEGRDLFNHVAYVLDAADQLKRDPSKVGKHITGNMAEFRQHEKDVADLRDKYPELNDALEMWREINKSLIKSAFDSGLINKKTRDVFMKNASYSPRYMLREEVLQRLGVQEGKATEVGNTRTKVFRERTAAEHQVNVWENMTRHYAGMTLGIMANETKKAIGEQFVAVGAAREVERAVKKELQGNLAVMVNGERKFYKVDSPELIPSMMQVQMDFGPLMKVARGATQMLRAGALNNPGNWIRQIARDPIAATLATNLGWITPAHTMKELTSIMQGNNPTYDMLARRGVIGHVDPSVNASDVHHFMDTLSTRMKNKGAIAAAVDKGATLLNKTHIAVDGATRVAIYKEALLRAHKEGLHGKDAENYAVMMARENINFSVTGSSQAMKQARLLIPFLSAGINGLELMRKAITASNIPMKDRAEFRRQFLGKVATIGMLSAAYTMYMSGNEEYENVPDNKRYTNWVFPTGIKDHPMLIALPPEFAFIKWLPEMMVRYGMGTKSAQQLMAAAADQVKGMVPGGMGYSLLPVPQIMKPIVENWINRSFYTGEDIETKGEHYQLESDRSSATANLLSKTGISAPMWDNLFRGYGAELGMAAVWLADNVLKPDNAPVKPSKDFVELPGLGLKGIFGTKYASQQRTDFYAHKEDLDSFRSRLKTLQDQGRQEEVDKLAADPDAKKKLGMATVYDQIGRQMQQLGKEIKMLEANTDMNEATRNERIDQRKRNINILAAKAEKIYRDKM